MFEFSTALVLGAIAGIAATIFLYIKVLPKKLDGTFEKDIFQKLHDYFHFKHLYLEDVLKFIFVLATVVTVCAGAFLLLGYEESYHYSSWSGSYTTRESTFLYGLGLIVGGPISLRLVYEGMMMFILLVKNTIDINNKLPELKKQPTTVEEVVSSEE